MADRVWTGPLFAVEAWDVAPGVGIIVLGIAVAGVVALGLLWQSTAPSRVSPGPATMELRDEPPAVVDLLVGGFSVEDDAVPATVVDLAARRYFDVAETGGRVTLRLRDATAPDAGELTDYERRVLVHVRQHAVDGVTPAEVLTIGPEGVSERWFRSFVREVNKHGQSLGLCHRRLDLRHIVIAWVIVGVAFAPAWVVTRVGARTTDPTGWGSLGNVFVGLAFLVGFSLVWLAQRVSRSNAQTDTAAGREAAAHWMGVRDHYRGAGGFDDKPAASVTIWDRHLAYATAMGLAPVVQRQLPFETEHDRHAWSRATGTWRRVKIRYQAFVPAWGEHPGKVAFGALVQGAVAGLIAFAGFVVASRDFELEQLTDDQRRWVGLAGLVVAVLAAAVCLFSAWKLLLGLSDLFARRTIEGEVVRARVLRTGHRLPKVVQWALWSGHDDQGMRRDHDRRTRHFVAIDDGDGDSIVAHVVQPGLYQRVRQGARVRAVATPRLGYVRSIEMTAPPRPSAAHADTVHHELVEESVHQVGTRLAGSMQDAIADLEGMTGEDGTPLLDQVDDDGVTIRDRLAQSNDQFERLRNDPRIRNSPLGGLLDAFAAPPADDPEDARDPGDSSASGDADADS